MEKGNVKERLLNIENELFTYANALTHERNRAKDLLQETNLKILLKYKSFDGDDKFKNWAKTIMRNSFLNTTEHERKIMAVEDYSSFHHEMIYLPGRSDIVSEYNDIDYAVDNLPSDSGKIIRLLITGHKYEEIAMILNMPVGTVKSRVFNSRSILKKKLKDYLE